MDREKELFEWIRGMYREMRPEDKKDAERFFPELAESEDERIRNELIEFIKWSVDRRFMREDFHQAKRPSEWIAYLEKLKETLHISETCKDVIVAIEKYLDWLTGYPDYAPRGKYSIRDMLYCLSLLEKQKEQKPSTEETELNSVAFLEQMGYTCIPPKKEHQNNSDAPKNALGGALNSPLDKDKNLDDIAQDYVEVVKEYNPEPTWDLMQTAVCYGYHYREEEEQKPNIELIQRSWYMEGYHDREFGQEPKWVIKTGKGGPKYEKNEKYGQPLERKPAEWSEEDEKMLEAFLHKLEVCVLLTNKEVTWAKHRLKSLRPQPHWKPSEEQMYELNWASKLSPVLESLYNDLKKLC